VGAVLIVVGDALAFIALFAPWLRLSTSFGETAGAHSYGPWTLLRAELDAGGSALNSILLWIYLPAAVMIASSVLLLIARDPRRRASLAIVTLLLAVGGLIVALLVLAAAPTGLALSWPFYSTKSIEFGAVAGLASLACVALGASASATWW
jgi:hypothetical protein